MNDILDKTLNSAKWFDELLKHDSFLAIAVPLLLSWFATVALALILRDLPPSKYRRIWIRLFDIGVAAIACAWMWPHPHAVIWGALVGFASPVLYYLLSALLTWWKPALKPYISLGELTAPPIQSCDHEQLDEDLK